MAGSDYSRFTFWDWDKEPVLEGIYIGQYRGIGRFKKNALSFRLKNNAVVQSWSFAELHRQFYGIPFGSEVKITYGGLESAPDTGYKVKVFDVEIVAPPPKKNDSKNNKKNDEKDLGRS